MFFRYYRRFECAAAGQVVVRTDLHVFASYRKTPDGGGGHIENAKYLQFDRVNVK